MLFPFTNLLRLRVRVVQYVRVFVSHVQHQLIIEIFEYESLFTISKFNHKTFVVYCYRPYERNSFVEIPTTDRLFSD